MITSQLGRTLLSAVGVSEDAASMAPTEGGGYGELMDLIDRILAEQRDRPEEGPA